MRKVDSKRMQCKNRIWDGVTLLLTLRSTVGISGFFSNGRIPFLFGI